MNIQNIKNLITELDYVFSNVLNRQCWPLDVRLRRGIVLSDTNG